MGTGHDYYGYLGVNRGSSAEEISKNYRKLALKYDPNSTGNDPRAAAKLKLIQEAHDVLSDPAKREAYDRVWFADIESEFGSEPASTKAAVQAAPGTVAAWQGLGIADAPPETPRQGSHGWTLGIQLTTGQMIQVAIILVVLGVAGYFVFQSTRPAFDTVVNSWVPPVKHFGRNGGRITTTNPKDPKLDEQHNMFACSDGEMDIIEYPGNPDKHARIVLMPETRIPNKVYIYYKDPMAHMETIKDAFRHGLAFATYNAVDWGPSFPHLKPKPQGLLGSAGMTPDQAAQEKKARDEMNAQLSLVQAGIEGGTYQSKLMDEVMKALKAYQAKAGDPKSDAGKAALARKVFEAVTAFENKLLQDDYKYIDAYMDKMADLLNQTQKDAFIAAVDARLSPRTTPRVGTQRAPAPTAGGTGAASRGAAAARGAAGTRAGAARGGRGAATATAPAGG